MRTGRDWGVLGGDGFGKLLDVLVRALQEMVGRGESSAKDVCGSGLSHLWICSYALARGSGSFACSRE